MTSIPEPGTIIHFSLGTMAGATFVALLVKHAVKKAIAEYREDAEDDDDDLAARCAYLEKRVEELVNQRKSINDALTKVVLASDLHLHIKTHVEKPVDNGKSKPDSVYRYEKTSYIYDKETDKITRKDHNGKT